MPEAKKRGTASFETIPLPTVPAQMQDSAATHFTSGLHDQKFALHVRVDVTPKSILFGLTDTARRIVLGGLGEDQGRGLSRIHVNRLDAVRDHFLPITFHANRRVLHDP